MAFYNWGEQVSNSFMNMLAMNQQKKLEEKRNQFEQQRLGMAETQLGYAKQEMDSKLETEKQQRLVSDQAYKYQQTLIDEAARKQQMDMANGGYLDMTNNNQDDKTFFNAADFERYMPMSYQQASYNKFNSLDGTTVPTTEWMRQGEMDSLLKRYADQFTQESGLYSDEKTRELQRQQIGQSGYGNSIEQQKLDMLKADTYSSNMNNAITTLKSNLPQLKDLFFIKNGVLWEKSPDSPETKNFWATTAKQQQISEHDLEQAITGVMRYNNNLTANTPSGNIKPALLKKGYDISKGGAMNSTRTFTPKKWGTNKHETIDRTTNQIYGKDIVYDKNGYATIVDPSTGKSYYVTRNGNYEKK